MIVASIEQMRAMTQISHLTPISLRLINGLRRIAATNLDLPLVPLNNNKQPLGDGWQHRPFSAAQLIEAIENGGVNVPIKGKTKQIQPQGFGLLTGHPLPLNNETYYLMAVDQDGRSAIRPLAKVFHGMIKSYLFLELATVVKRSLSEIAVRQHSRSETASK